MFTSYFFVSLVIRSLADESNYLQVKELLQLERVPKAANEIR